MPPSPFPPERVLLGSNFPPSDTDTFPERHHTEPTRDTSHNTSHSDVTLHSTQGEALHDFRGTWSQRYAPANDFRQSYTPIPGADASTRGDQAPQSLEPLPCYSLRNDGGLLRGVEVYTEHTRPGGWNMNPIPGMGERQGAQAASPRGYNTHSRSVSLASPALAHMQSLPYPSSRHSSAPPQAPGTTKFARFGGLFSSSAQAKAHRKVRMRFDRQAYNPEDPSVSGIEAERGKHVERIYNAMVRGDRARDNEKSVAMKRWTREPHYASDMVEAFAHKVFDCLLEQAKDGFRGWHHNDYVVDDRKGDDADRDIDCAGRLENIILALEQEKTICEDVMNSACQIRMFVNAPRAYANRKHQNRIGNSKRPNAGVKEDVDANTRASKMRKTAPKKSRGRSSTMSDVDASQPPTLQLPLESTGLPYFVTPASQRMATSPLTRGYLAANLSPSYSVPAPAQLQPSPFGQLPASGMSPPASSPRALPQGLRPAPPMRITSMPPIKQSPFTPPTFTHDHFSAPATPDDAQLGNTGVPANPWRDRAPFEGPPFRQTFAADDPLFTQVVDWSQNVPAFVPCEELEGANLFENFPDGCVSLADIERVPPAQAGSGTAGVAGIDNMWQQHDADEHFSYDDLPPELQPGS